MTTLRRGHNPTDVGYSNGLIPSLKRVLEGSQTDSVKLLTIRNIFYLIISGTYGSARRGSLGVAVVEIVVDELLTANALQRAKPRPKRLKVIKANRMKAATAMASGGGGQVLKGVSAQEGAAAILKLLVEEGVVR